MGKPLISNAAMLGMYKTMQRLRITKRSPALTAHLSRMERSRLLSQPESLYAALLSQTHRRDTLLTEGGDPLMESGVDVVWPVGKAKPTFHSLPGTSQECAGYAIGMALQCAAARKQNAPVSVVLALLREFSGMSGTLQCIQERDLCVLLIVQGAPESRPDAQRRLLTTKVPVMPVDATDAVAMCRVLQECMLRARNGWGGAVIHALHLPDADDPLAMLEVHLRKRGLEPPIT